MQVDRTTALGPAPPLVGTRWAREVDHQWTAANQRRPRRASDVGDRTQQITSHHRRHQGRLTRDPWVVGSSPTRPLRSCAISVDPRRIGFGWWSTPARSGLDALAPPALGCCGQRWSHRRARSGTDERGPGLGALVTDCGTRADDGCPVHRCPGGLGGQRVVDPARAGRRPRRASAGRRRTWPAQEAQPASPSAVDLLDRAGLHVHRRVPDRFRVCRRLSPPGRPGDRAHTGDEGVGVTPHGRGAARRRRAIVPVDGSDPAAPRWGREPARWTRHSEDRA